jgi:hypothetical protein
MRWVWLRTLLTFLSRLSTLSLRMALKELREISQTRYQFIGSGFEVQVGALAHLPEIKVMTQEFMSVLTLLTILMIRLLILLSDHCARGAGGVYWHL